MKQDKQDRAIIKEPRAPTLQPTAHDRAALVRALALAILKAATKPREQ